MLAVLLDFLLKVPQNLYLKPAKDGWYLRNWSKLFPLLQLEFVDRRKEILNSSKILPFLSIYNCEHKANKETGNLGLVCRVFPHMQNSLYTEWAQNTNNLLKYSNTSVQTSVFQEADSTFSETAVRTMAWVIMESPKINRSALFMFFTETPNTSSWLNLLESHVHCIKKDAWKILPNATQNQQTGQQVLLIILSE